MKYETLATAFKQKLKSVEHVTLTTDIWTDFQMKSFLGVTLHYLSDQQLRSATLGVVELSETHTADYISDKLLTTLNEWEISLDIILAVVTDNGANIVKAITNTFGKNRHIPCFAHTLNLVCENTIKNCDGLIDLLEKVRSVVVWFRRTVKANDELRKLQNNDGIPEGSTKKTILDVKTRWNSTFYMLERFLELSRYISIITFNNMSAPIMLTPYEMEQLKEVKKFLHPLERLTKEVSSEKYVTVSKIIPLVNCCLENYKAIEPDSQIGRKLKASLQAEFSKRFGQIEKSFILATSTMLDPRFKQIHFQDALACSHIINFLKSEVTALNAEVLAGSSESDSGNEEIYFDVWAHHKRLAHSKRSKDGDTKINEVSQYMQNPVCNLSENILQVWEDMKPIYPALYRIAQKYLCAVGTSVPSERLFSKAGATASKTRNRLTGSRLSKLLFLNSLQEEF